MGRMVRIQMGEIIKKIRLLCKEKLIANSRKEQIKKAIIGSI
jgi:hypothetical protein